ncbi:hypothetical protein GOP47_0023919 [Adiantum capillus-veneris]|uniref:Uncharacterized protein n=1 Tax=Adiantum capillus-veneris TaxID=13818 RepID=A0A9D4U4E9_ADICA|nr:hypothetical protein GOP47_0023919 [Adiantum capillus-veneris]
MSSCLATDLWTREAVELGTSYDLCCIYASAGFGDLSKLPRLSYLDGPRDLESASVGVPRGSFGEPTMHRRSQDLD